MNPNLLQSSTPHPSRSGLWPLTVGGLLLLTSVLYVASIGPAYWLYYKNLISERSISTLDTTFYAPLWWVGNRVPAVNAAMNDYCNWWIDLVRGSS